MATKKPQLRAHTNKEDVRKCPYCGQEVLSRGLYVHVYNSDDEEHGPRDSVPDDFDPMDTEVVGKREVTVLNPTEYKVDHRRFICDYCGDTFRGELGMKIHLGRSAGKDEEHPADAEDRPIDSFESFPATSEGEVIVDTEEKANELEGINAGILINESDEPAENLLNEHAQTKAADGPAVPISELEELRDQFYEDDEHGRNVTAYHAAERVDRLIERHSS